MFLAALPPGKWHIGWVRDGAYAIVAQAMAGHLDEAREGVEFFLSAWAGFFNSPEYLGRHYRISSVRYYGKRQRRRGFQLRRTECRNGRIWTGSVGESIYAL